MNKNFELKSTCGTARAGMLKTRAGEIATPFFMTVATRGAVKAGVSMEDLESINAPVVLCNTYHLCLEPGAESVENLGGLREFMKCEKPILTDSGGFQVFSIRQKKITDEGVFFHSHIDGKKIFLDAQASIRIQHQLGADLIMAFDECPPSRLERKSDTEYFLLNTEDRKKWEEKQEKKLYFQVKKAVERTTDWAKKSLDFHFSRFPETLIPTQRPQIFGIVQGGIFSDLRNKSLREITALNFDGFALGGLAVGETSAEMYKVLEEMCPKMPVDRPRYLMGVGTPENLIEAVSRGIDMFDCVYPSRNARHGTVFTQNGILKITNARWKNSKEVVDETCGCPTCKNGFSRGYLQHLIRVGEVLGQRYLTLHNLYFYHYLMREMRKNILAGTFEDWKQKMLERIGKQL